MKLLVRTITIATVGLFMIIICLHSMIIETVKNGLDVAATNALNRTIDAYVKNEKLKAEDDDNLYFKTNSEYYYFFYDSLIVQLNGYISVDIVCNDVDVETGDLDVDITIRYQGLDYKERAHTVHVDTYNRINVAEIRDEYKANLLRELALIETGDSVEWAGHSWIVLDNDTEDLKLVLNEDAGRSDFGSIDYRYSNIRISAEAVIGSLESKYKELFNSTTLKEFNTTAGFYTINGQDTFVAEAFILSSSEASKISGKLNITEPFWLRTIASTNEAYVMTGSGIGTMGINETAAVRPAVNISKSKIQTLDKDGDVYQIDKE